MKRTCVARSLALTSVSFAASIATAQNAVIRVDPAAPTPLFGDDWATAYHTVQAALADSRLTNQVGQHEIWIRGGAYDADALDPGNPDASFELVFNTMLYGGFAGNEDERVDRDIDAHPAILSGEIDSTTNSLHVVRASNVGASETRRFGLNGITVTGGRAIRNTGDPAENGRGGGLFVESSANRLGISTCHFIDNEANIGGGIFMDLRPSFGVVASETDRLIVSTTFSDNVAGVGIETSIGNVDAGGGGIAMLGGDNGISVLNCLFHDNLVTGSSTPGNGGAVGGGAMLLLKTSPRIIHATIMHNSAIADAIGPGIYAGFSSVPFPPPETVQSTVKLQNAIVFANDRLGVKDFDAQIAVGQYSAIGTLSHSSIEGIDLTTWPDNNTDVGPVLATPGSPASDRYALSPLSSSCVDTADPFTTGTDVFRDRLDVDDDGIDSEATPDIDRGVRIFPGEPCDPMPDIGANEYSLPCPADLDGSGAVDFADILAVLAAWGPSTGPADLDEDGIVDFDDLLILLAAFGPCPGYSSECFPDPDDLGDISECLQRFASEPEKLAACIEAVIIAQSAAGSGP